MKKIVLTPNNTGYGNEYTDISTYSEKEFNETEERKVLNYKPDRSYFTLKSVKLSAYIERAITNIKGGDILTIEFDVMKIGESNSTINIKLLPIQSNGLVDGNKSIDNYTYPVDSNSYNHMKVSIPLNNDFGEYGCVLNIRNEQNNSILKIKDVSIVVKTNKTRVFNEKMIRIRNDVEFDNVLSLTSKINNIDYSACERARQNGNIYYDGAALNIHSQIEGYNGLTIPLPEADKSNPIIVTLTYKCTGNNFKLSILDNSETTTVYHLKESTNFQFKTVVLNPYISKRGKLKKMTLEIGNSTNSVGELLTIKEVMINLPFNDFINENNLNYLLDDCNQNNSLREYRPLFRGFLIKKVSNGFEFNPFYGKFNNKSILTVRGNLLIMEFKDRFFFENANKGLAFANVSGDSPLLDGKIIRCEPLKFNSTSCSFAFFTGDGVPISNLNSIPTNTHINVGLFNS